MTDYGQDKNGVWKMNGPNECLVTKSSATHCHSWEDSPEHMCAIARTHSDMVKFGPHDDEYRKVRERLIRLVQQVLVVSNATQVRKQGIFCYRCDELGHKSPGCCAPKHTVVEGVERRKKQGRCRNCGRNDHWWRRCNYPDPRRTRPAD